MVAPVAAREVKRLAQCAGFDLVGIAPAAALDDFDRYAEWIERGFHGAMAYLEKGTDARREPRSMLAEARSVVVCALNYLTPHSPGDDPGRAGRPVISRYAWGGDYHRIIRRRLKRFVGLLEESLGRTVHSRLCVDTMPLLERAYAARAGIGWIGRNCCLIHPTFGSFLFLGEALIDVELEADRPIRNRCGRCRRCLEACPTVALVEPYRLDARRCISYLTVELRGEIDPALEPLLGTRVFGCDVCQDVCPWNRKARRRLSTIVRDFWPRPQLDNPDFEGLVFPSEDEFRAALAGTPLLRARWDGWRRNVAVAIRNVLDSCPFERRGQLLSLLERLSNP